MQTQRWAPVLGIVGLGLHLLVQTAAADWHMTGRSVPVATAAIVLTLLTIGFTALLPEGRLQQLRRVLPALAPLGLLLGAEALLTMAGRALPLLAGGPEVGCGLVGLELSFALLATIALTTIAATWTGCALLRIVDGQPPEAALAEGLVDVPSRIWRGFGALAIGHGVTYGILAGLMLVATTAPAAMMILPVIAVLAMLAWNLVSATLLLAVLRSDAPFRRAAWEALTTGRRHARAFARPVLAQLALLGTLVVLPGGYSAQLIWVGSFAGDSNWLSEIVEAHGERTTPLFETLLIGASLWLAVAIKLRIARSLQAADDDPERR